MTLSIYEAEEEEENVLQFVFVPCAFKSIKKRPALLFLFSGTRQLCVCCLLRKEEEEEDGKQGNYSPRLTGGVVVDDVNKALAKPRHHHHP